MTMKNHNYLVLKMFVLFCFLPQISFSAEFPFGKSAPEVIIDSYEKNDLEGVSVGAARCVAVINLGRQFGMFDTKEDESLRSEVWSRLMRLVTLKYRESSAEPKLSYDQQMEAGGAQVMQLTEPYFSWIKKEEEIARSEGRSFIALFKSEYDVMKESVEFSPMLKEFVGCVVLARKKNNKD